MESIEILALNYDGLELNLSRVKVMVKFGKKMLNEGNVNDYQIR